ncbi:MAG: PIN domain-containing protein [Polyangia bacterium]
MAPRERINDAALRNGMVTSSIVVAELLYGVARSSRPEGNRRVALRGIQRFDIVPFTFSTRRELACQAGAHTIVARDRDVTIDANDDVIVNGEHIRLNG